VAPMSQSKNFGVRPDGSMAPSSCQWLYGGRSLAHSLAAGLRMPGAGKEPCGGSACSFSSLQLALHWHGTPMLFRFSDSLAGLPWALAQ